MTIYKAAIQHLTIAKLSEFLKTPEAAAILEIEGWSDMRAPTKRDEFMQALAASVEFRKLFTDFYNAAVEDDKKIDWMEAEKQVLSGANAPMAAASENAGQENADPENVASENAASEDVASEDAVQATETSPDNHDIPQGSAVSAPESTAEIVPMPAKSNSKVGALSAVLPGAPMVGQFVEGAFDQIVADAAGLTAEQANQAVHAAEEDLEFNHLRLGVLLNQVNSAQHYKALGYETLQDYLDAETGLHYRKAMNLIKNAITVKELGIPAKELKGVTWAALRHIVPVLTADNYKVWLEAARSMKHVSLIAAVKSEQAKAFATPVPTASPGGAVPADVGMSQKVFAVYPDQKANIDAAIEKAKAEAGVESQGAALDVIAAAYNAAPVSPSSAMASGAQGGIPDLSTPALTNYLTKIAADEGDAGCVRLLTIIGEIWPHISIDVDFDPKKDGDAAAA